MIDDIYQPEQRVIFHYYSGEAKGIVKADPMVLYKRFMAIRGDFQAEYAIAFSPSKDAQTAHSAMIKKIQHVFDLPESYEKGGLTEAECIELVQFFWSWCDRVKKNLRSTPTSPDATSEISPSPTEENPPTKSTLDSGSISQENQTDVPGPVLSAHAYQLEE